jgi:hypothetical protein
MSYAITRFSSLGARRSAAPEPGGELPAIVHARRYLDIRRALPESHHPTSPSRDIVGPWSGELLESAEFFQFGIPSLELGVAFVHAAKSLCELTRALAWPGSTARTMSYPVSRYRLPAEIGEDG